MVYVPALARSVFAPRDEKEAKSSSSKQTHDRTLLLGALHRHGNTCGCAPRHATFEGWLWSRAPAETQKGKVPGRDPLLEE
jgi:hypothetical protein